MDEKNNKEETKSDDKLSLCEIERDEYLNGWKRAKADLINAKREWEEKMKILGGYVRAEVVLSLLPILDALEGTKDISGWSETQKLVADTFSKLGVREIESLGKEFNPEFHESAGESEGKENIIIEVVRKGYKIGDTVIRPVRVIIGKMSNS